MLQHITVNCFKNNFHSQNSLVMDGSALKHFKHPDYKNALEGTFRCHNSGNKLEGDWGEIVAQGAEILP